MRTVRETDVQLDTTAGDAALLRELAAPWRSLSIGERLEAIHRHLSDVTVAEAEWTSPLRGHFTSTQMMAPNRAWGCSAHAQIACHLARAAGVPAILVKTIDVDSIPAFGESGRLSGHVYLELLIDGEPALWDAQGGRLIDEYDAHAADLFDDSKSRLVQGKGAPDDLILSHHGPEWERDNIGWLELLG